MLRASTPWGVLHRSTEHRAVGGNRTARGTGDGEGGIGDDGGGRREGAGGGGGGHGVAGGAGGGDAVLGREEREKEGRLEVCGGGKVEASADASNEVEGEVEVEVDEEEKG